MKRKKILMIGVATALATVASLNLLFGRRGGRCGKGFGNWQHRWNDGGNGQNRKITIG